MAAEQTTLSPRANIALLTLQLRAAVQEADAAEASASTGGVDVDASLQQLRARLDPLMAERRAALDAAMADERAAAAEAIAAAHREAAEIVAAAEAATVVAESEPIEELPLIVEAAALAAVVEEPLVPEESPVIEELVADEESVVSEEPVAADESVVSEEPVVVEEPVVTEEPPVVFAEFAKADEQPSTELATWPPPPPANTVTLDVDAFAKVMGAVLASVLDERLGQWQPPQQPPYPYTMQMPMQMPVPMVIQAAPAPAPPPKQGFWSSAKHPDVILMVIAMVIVLVVLAAWLA